MEDFQDLISLEEFENLLRFRRKRNVNSERLCDLYILDDIEFKKRYRLNKSTASYLLDRFGDKLEKSEKNCFLSRAEKLCIALRFYATGTFQSVIGDLSQVSQSSACRALHEVSHCLASLSDEFIKFPGIESEKKKVAQEFFHAFGFPGVLGALDCTHIPISSPGGPRAETFRNRKGFFSINVQTISDIHLRILNIVARWPGSTHDSTIFDHSYIRALFENNISHHYHLLGDNGYPCRRYLLTPFLEPSSASQNRYNASHIKARNVVERQYGLWKRRFACLSNGLRNDIDNTLSIIVATAVLHNIALSMNDTFDDEDADDNPNYQIINSLVYQNNTSGVIKRNLILQTFFNT